jgi:hypothetical protein
LKSQSREEHIMAKAKAGAPKGGGTRKWKGPINAKNPAKRGFGGGGKKGGGGGGGG